MGQTNYLPINIKRRLEGANNIVISDIFEENEDEGEIGRGKLVISDISEENEAET